MCAPQNFSADLLFKALSAAGITTDYMIRLNDPRVPPTQVSHHGVAVHCVWLPCCWGALHLAPKLLLCIAPCIYVVAVPCTLYLCRCCALHLASDVLPSNIFAKRQAFLAGGDVQSGTSGSQRTRTAGTKL